MSKGILPKIRTPRLKQTNTSGLFYWFDKSKTKISFKLEATVKLEGQYDMSGNLLFLSMKGNGPLHVKLRKIEVPININVKEVTGTDGKKYWNYEYVSHTYTLKEKSEVVFENLFSGNDILATAAKEMISQNGNEIIYEVGSPVLKAVIDSIIVRINELLNKISTDELYIS